MTGLYTNIAELQKDGRYLSLEGKQECNIHPSSVLFGGKPPYVLYTELVQTAKSYMHINTSVDPEWLVEIAPDYFRTKHLRK